MSDRSDSTVPDVPADLPVGQADPFAPVDPAALREEVNRLRWNMQSLERRLQQIEQVLQANQQSGTLHARASELPAAERPEAKPLHHPVSATSAASILPPPLPINLPVAARAPVAVQPPPLPRVSTAPAAPVADQPARPPRESSRSLETLIGQNWASWVGAIVLFLGIVFFLKYAWDQGWIRPSPAARVAAAVGCGVLLAAAGEWLHWRRMRPLAGTLWGAGIAVIIASFFGAHAYFDPPVITANTAFTAVAVTAAASVLAALHINVSVVAILGLIGAYLAPNLLAGPEDRSVFFITYLASLAAVGLGLVQFRKPWVLLRWLALVGSYVWLMLWWNATGRQHEHQSLAMLTLFGFAAVFVVECAFTLWRTARPPDGTSERPAEELFGIRIETGPLDVHAVTAALLAIFASMLQLLWVWDRAALAQTNLVAIGMAVLLVVPGIALSFCRPMWFAVRWAVLVGSYVWLALWWNDAGRAAGQETLALLWSLSLYAMFQAEGVLTLRRDDGAENAALDTNLAAVSLLGTAGTLGMLLWMWGGTAPATVGAIAIVLALVQGGAAMLGRARQFFVSSMLQSAGLITLAVPLILDEYAVTLAWIILAGVLALAAWQLNLPRARGWAAGLLLLALGRLLIFDWRNATLHAVEFEIFNQAVTRWLLTGWTIALLYHMLAWLRPGGGRWPALEEWIDSRVPPAPAASPSPLMRSIEHSPVLEYGTRVKDVIAARTLHIHPDGAGAFFAAFGTILFVALTLVRWSGPPATLALVLGFAGLLLLSKLGERIGYAMQAWILGMFVSVRWLVLENLAPLAQSWDVGGTAPALLNVPALCGVLLAGALIVGLRFAPRLSRPLPIADQTLPDQDRVACNVLVVWAAAVVFALLNFETIRYIDSIAGLQDRAIVKQVAMSVLWAIVGFGGILFGFRKDLAPVRWAALALLAITLAKILVIDMAEVRAIWRILSFVAVGILLLCVSFVYHRQVQPKVAEEK